MRRDHRTRVIAALALTLLAVPAGCGRGGPAKDVPVPGQEGRHKSAASERAPRRAYDGAPPVIPHPPMGAACVSCHNQAGIEVPELGFAPPTPHGDTRGMQALRCRQCHVFQETASLFRESSFQGLPQDLRHGDRLHPLAPPTIAHPVFMRENCLACHAGPAAREEIRTSHPERIRCRQCHVPAMTSMAARFAR